jgi:hypothetical protein
MDLRTATSWRTVAAAVLDGRSGRTTSRCPVGEGVFPHRGIGTSPWKAGYN